MSFKFTDARENNATGGKMVMVLDGYNAPVRCAPYCDANGPVPNHDVHAWLLWLGLLRRRLCLPTCSASPT